MPKVRFNNTILHTIDFLLVWLKSKWKHNQDIKLEKKVKTQNKKRDECKYRFIDDFKRDSTH